MRIELKTSRGSNAGASLSLLFPAAVQGELVLRWEKKFDRSGKELGISNEMQTGDRFFDECLYIDSDDSESFREYFSSPVIRQSIINLFLHIGGNLKICFFHGHISSEISPISPGMFRRMDLTRIMENLRIVGEDFSKKDTAMTKIQREPPDSITKSDGGKQPDRNRSMQAHGSSVYLYKESDSLRSRETTRLSQRPKMLVGKFVFLTLFSILFPVFVRQSYPPLRTGLVFYLKMLLLGSCFSLLYLWRISKKIRGRSYSHKALKLAVIPVLLAFISISEGMFLLANGYLDRNPPLFSAANVIKIEPREESGQIKMVVILVMLDDPRIRHSLEYPLDSFPSIKTGDRVRVKIRRGFLGWPWCLWDKLEWVRKGEENPI